MFIIILPMQLLIPYFYINQLGNQRMDTSSFIIVTVITTTLLILFYGLKPIVNQNSITLLFGIGLVRKHIPLQRIESISPTKNNHLYGWAIRFSRGGILYNISGSEALELQFKDLSRRIRIGTQNTDRLIRELANRLGN
jgi:hypothetical protein